jgi:hypothetical protein
MPTLGEVDRTGRIQKTVRKIFSMARKKREPLDELENVALDHAAHAQTTILILNYLLRTYGPLTLAQAEAYAQATAHRDAYLRALQIENPYRESAH